MTDPLSREDLEPDTELIDPQTFQSLLAAVNGPAPAELDIDMEDDL